MDKIVLIFPVISVALLFLRGFSFTFVYFIVPTMLFLPAYLTYDAPGVPPLTFYLAAMMPFFLKPELYKSMFQDFHWLDLFIYLYCIVLFFSELSNMGFMPARQFLVLHLFSFVAPYFAAKYVILHERKELVLALVVIVVLGLIGIYSMYTWRFGVNHYIILRNRWPFSMELPPLAVWPRWGGFRASGPFMHPIAAGIAFGFAMPVAMWLYRTKALKPNWLLLGMFAGCMAGLATSMSRGPYIGAVIAVAVFLAGQSKFRVQFFSIAFALSLFMVAPASWKISELFNATRATASSEEHETLLYRRDLILNYMEVISEKPVLGYSIFGIPYVGDQRSIDNAYIYLALCWGIFSPLSLLILMFGAMIGLTRIGLRPHISAIQRGQMWALIGGIAGCGFSIATVFLSRPVYTVLVIWIGWSAAILLRSKRGFYDKKEDEAVVEEVSEMEIPKTEMRIL